MEQLLIMIDPELKKRVRMEAVKQDISMRDFLTGIILSHFGDTPTEEETAHKNTHECKKCGGSWESHRERPAVCPYCKSYTWMIPKSRAKVFLHTCQACNYHWENNKEFPSACPSCKSRAWDGPTPVMIRADFERIYRNTGLHAAAVASKAGIPSEEFTMIIRRERPATAQHLQKMKEAFGL